MTELVSPLTTISRRTVGGGHDRVRGLADSDRVTGKASGGVCSRRDRVRAVVGYIRGSSVRREGDCGRVGADRYRRSGAAGGDVDGGDRCAAPIENIGRLTVRGNGDRPRLQANRDWRTGLLVAVSIGVTVSEPVSTTYAVAPSGVTAIAAGSRPTGIDAAGLGRRVDRRDRSRAAVDDVHGAAVGSRGDRLWVRTNADRAAGLPRHE